MLNSIVSFNTPEIEPYPPYHNGDYLEEYFAKFYFENKKNIKDNSIEYIPVPWTVIYNLKKDLFSTLQQQLNKLPLNKKYFTVSQHDDAPLHHALPLNTLHFSAGGNAPNTIPIPLICSRIPPEKTSKNVDKEIFASFVGSATHPIRIKMLETLVNKTNEYVLKPRQWTPGVPEKRTELFIDITLKSKFCLAPRGYGKTSFRLYEAMQLNSIPVYFYDGEPFLPFKNKIKWEDLCILIPFNQIEHTHEILKSVSEEKYKHMKEYMKQTYNQYFTLEGTCKEIFNILNNV